MHDSRLANRGNSCSRWLTSCYPKGVNLKSDVGNLTMKLISNATAVMNEEFL